jgi:DHA1 family tetracycline resistance protein-like MFS transporter
MGQVATCMTAFGLCSFAVQAGLSGRLVRWLGEPPVVLIGMLCAVLGTAIFGLAPNGTIFWIGIPVMTLSGVAGPAVQSLMTRRVSASEQGRLQGANASLQAIAGIVAPVLFGIVYTLAHGSGGGPAVLGAPFVLASVTLLIGVGLAVRGVRAPARI